MPVISPSTPPQLKGYSRFELLYEGQRTSVFRALWEEKQRSVVIKFLRADYPSLSELVQFRNQYAIAHNLPIPGIVSPLGLEPWGNSYALIMEDDGGISLQTYAQDHDLSWQEVWAIALQLTHILHDLCKHRVIHKNIQPGHILIHPDTQQIKLMDFSIASLLQRESREIQSPRELEGTVAYLAPEQTGRMNRGIDYRADFYALGVTLYQLLTGRLPFESEDLMELIHCHIAQSPILPHQVNTQHSAQIPTAVSSIVMKLMAKNAEDRYQSALGLKSDLQHCLSQWAETGQIHPFELGKRDISDRFLIPEKLYGRDAEVQILWDAFERVSQGNSELVLVAGMSGIGKTAVIHELHKPITQKKGYFIQGKFDQFNRNIPFSAFTQAFRSLMEQLLGAPPAVLAEWKAKILNAVGESGQVLIEVIPELELIIEAQPAVPELTGIAAQNRFNQLFREFVQVFTAPEHPLVIFLDDLQWADSASLNLLKLLMAPSESGCLLALGAYRDNEVFPAHPLMLTLDELKKTASIKNIRLQPLRPIDVSQLLVETLNSEIAVVSPISDFVYQKTQGNPFFTTQFLQGLHRDGHINFDVDLGCWQCDLSQLKQLVLTDDSVTFMLGQLQKLTEAEQATLKIAACLGNKFDLATLAIVCEQSQNYLSTTLWRSLQTGLIIPETDHYKFFQADSHSTLSPSDVTIGYRFLHDRVQQAAYALVPESDRKIVHWKIGQLLWREQLNQDHKVSLFEIINHLNQGYEPHFSPNTQQELADLNLQAGIKAKRSAAYRVAYDYCITGIKQLTVAGWETQYDLMYRLHYQGAELAYLCGEFEQAETFYKTTLSHACTAIEKAAIYRLQMTQYQLQGRNRDAISIQRKSLNLLGWYLPDSPELVQTALDSEIRIIQEFLTQHSIESILELSRMDDASMIEMLRILQILFYAAFLDGQSTVAFLALAKMASLSLQYGNSEMSPFGYVGYGMLTNVVLKQPDQAYLLSKMAVQLCEQFDNPDIRGVTNFLFAADVHSWTRPIRESYPYYDDAYTYSMQAGNWLTVNFMMMQSSSDRLTAGENLPQLLKQVEPYADFLSQTQSYDNRDALIAGVLQPIRQLLGLTNNLFSFDDESFNEVQYQQKYHGAPYHLAWLYSVKIRHAYLFDQTDTYPDLVSKLSLIEQTVATHTKVPSSVFYVALMYLSLLENLRHQTDEKLSQCYWQTVETLALKLEEWAQSCPENIHHKCLLVRAEIARLNNDKTLAIELYDQAIAHAQEQVYLYEEALANELAAKFYLKWGKHKVAASYLQDAYYCYSRWGASAKTAQLVTVYPHLLEPVLPSWHYEPDLLPRVETSQATPRKGSKQTTHPGMRSLSTALDFAPIIQSAQLLSSNLELEGVIAQLMKLVLQTSGAKTCLLILPQMLGIQTAHDPETQSEWLVHQLADPIAMKTSTCDPEARSQGAPILSSPQRLCDCSDLPHGLIQYVRRTGKPVHLDGLEHDYLNLSDPYMIEHQPKSVLVQAIHHQNALIGVLYLENRITAKVFKPSQRTVIDFFCNQAGIALENARLYQIQMNQAQALFRKNQDLQGAKQAAEAASQAKSYFMQKVSHELRTPLNGILGYSQILERSQTLSTTDRQGIETIHQCGKELLSLVSDIISISQTETKRLELNLSEVNLPAFLRNVMAQVKPQLKGNAVQLRSQLGSQLPERVLTDEKQLRHVLLNLLENGIKFTEQGSVCLHVDLMAMSDTQASVKFQVIDTGIGIDEANHQHLFHLFEQVKNTQTQAGGLGVGLAISQRIIQQMGGEIIVSSQLGQGSEFSFILSLSRCGNGTSPRLESPLAASETIESSSVQLKMGNDVATENPEEIMLPSGEELQQLLTFSQLGRLRKMRQQLETLMEKDPCYSSFATSLLRLEKQFKMDEIESLLRQYISSSESLATKSDIAKIRLEADHSSNVA